MVHLDVFSREPAKVRKPPYGEMPEAHASKVRDFLRTPKAEGVSCGTQERKAENQCITLDDVTVSPFIRLAILNSLDGSSVEARKRLQMPIQAFELGFLRSGSFFSVTMVESELKARYPHGNFKTKIEKAWKTKAIDQEERELLHALRELRNSFCHDMTTPVRLCDALDVLRTSAYILTKLLPDK